MEVDAVIEGLSPAVELNDGAEQSLLVQVFDRIALPTFVIDKDHVVRHWNSALEALTGLDRSEMIGSRNHWKPFYRSPRPCLADLMLEGGQDEEVLRYYKNKYLRSTLINDAYEAEDFFPECGEDGEWLHFTAAPLHNSQGEVIGAIETLMNISGRKKAELELIARERTYREQSITDSLTGLYNSRYFHQQLELAVANTERFERPFSLCFLDLDHFKQLNDNHGHLVGDKVLESFAEMVSSSLRKVDSGYRYGGEEFALLLPGTDENGAKLVAERIRQHLSDHHFQLERGKCLNASVSIGIAEYHSGDTVRGLLKRADQALYQAKDAGRDCVMVADNETSD
ncbi:MAG: sensor domain-containing diguanylate cyclase [Motiliproteus sp.]|nr:sensor domain-containing diguanylate cyclase [Motiliproteus sp.]MCW9053407.1 sensor domain-containing diguanylate cyclase [Motiliproteus sp.]